MRKAIERLPLIYAIRCRMALAIYPPARREQLLYAGVLDLTTHETYGSECHHPPR